MKHTIALANHPKHDGYPKRRRRRQVGLPQKFRKLPTLSHGAHFTAGEKLLKASLSIWASLDSAGGGGWQTRMRGKSWGWERATAARTRASPSATSTSVALNPAWDALPQLPHAPLSCFEGEREGEDTVDQDDGREQLQDILRPRPLRKLCPGNVRRDS